MAYKTRYLKIKGQPIPEGVILINEWGHYFDYLLKGAKGLEVEEGPKEAEKPLIIEYPTYDKLIKEYQETIAKNPIVILTPAQKKEIELLKPYLPVWHIPFSEEQFLKFANITKELLDTIANKDRYARIIYIFLKVGLEMGWNPSRCQNINRFNYQTFCKEDFKNLPEKCKKARQYYETKHFSLDVMLDAIYEDLTGKPQGTVELIMMLMPKGELSKLIIKEHLTEAIDQLKRYGDIYETDEKIGLT